MGTTLTWPWLLAMTRCAAHASGWTWSPCSHSDLGIRTLLPSGIEFALFVLIDASPQWRGRELYGGTLDLFVHLEEGPSYSRHLLPVLNLGTLYITAFGKSVGLLWMLVLMIGPDYSTRRSVLMRIRALTTDLGGRIQDS